MARTRIVSLVSVVTLVIACGAGDRETGAPPRGGSVVVTPGPLSVALAQPGLCGDGPQEGDGKHDPSDGETGKGTGFGAAGAAGSGVAGGTQSSGGTGGKANWAGAGKGGGSGSSQSSAGGSPSALGTGGAGGAGDPTGSAGTGGEVGSGQGGAAGTGGEAALDGGAAGGAGCVESVDGGDGGLDCAPDAGSENEAGGKGGEDGGAPPAPPPPPHWLSDETAALCEGVDLSTPVKLFLSADDSNSMASPVIVRSLIRRHQPIDPYLVRTYEFLNYYRFSFAKPRAGDLAIVSQLGSCQLNQDLALQIAVQSAPLAADRPPIDVTLVLDTSGSMTGDPIDRERAAVRAIASSLRAGDRVSAVTWSVGQTPILSAHEVSGPDDPALEDLADGLQPGGGTDLSGGLRAGYELAKSQRSAWRLSRVILISDGQANAGITDEDLIGSSAEDQDREGIYLVGVGVGEGYNDRLMDTVTDAGRGAYIYLDSAEEARRMLVDRFAESMLVAARGVRIELTLPPYFGIKRFYGEVYSPDPAKVRPQHLAPDDSMVLYQILHPCDPSLPRAEDPYRVRVTWNDATSGAAREVIQDTVLGALDVDDGNLTKAALVILYAETLKSLAGLDATARTLRVQSTRDAISAKNAGDPDLTEIVGLLDEML
jgi:Ca-activated chloride channel homolog